MSTEVKGRRRRRGWWRLEVLAAVILCVALAPAWGVATRASAAAPAQAVVPQLEQVAGAFAGPIFVTHAGDGSGRLFVVERAGRIQVVVNGQTQTTPFLDIVGRVNSSTSEMGLLGLVFHPNYVANGIFYVFYTASNGDNTLARVRRSAGNANLADAASLQVLFADADPYPNHNGGMLAFGPDGHLYVGTGDGGDAGDPQNRAQNLGLRFGKLLRLDVSDDADGVENDGLPYAIPAGNPFVGRAGALPEIWALGLRNPWRYSFDRLTGDLWIGDVGQGQFEEIDRLSAGSAGGANFQWRCLEGTQPYLSDPPCTEGVQTPPIFTYDHSEGRCSLTGGYVYRGSLAPSLLGAYVFGDFCGGQIYALRQTAGVWRATLLLDTTYRISSFGQDQAGELYLADLTGGRIYRFTEGTAPPATPSATGAPSATRTPTNTPTATTVPATPTATRTPTATAPVATATITPTALPATATTPALPTAPPGAQTVAFDDRAGQNQPLNGQYPAGAIDWGSGAWFHSGPWGSFSTKSASFAGPGRTSAAFDFVAPRRLVSLRAYNGGGAATLTLSCAGQPDRQAALAAGQVLTVATGWSGTCTSVTVTSSNGWDTNIDDLVFDGG